MTIAGIIGYLAANGASIVAAVNGALGGLIGVCLLIPGDQPEKALQGIVDFLSKFSKK